MSNAQQSSDPKIQAHIDKLIKHDRKIEHFFRRALHFLEQLIAALTIIVLLAALGLEVFHMFTEPGYFADVEHVLHKLLTIVVGLEFVRMLIDSSAAS